MKILRFFFLLNCINQKVEKQINFRNQIKVGKIYQINFSNSLDKNSIKIIQKYNKIIYFFISIILYNKILILISRANYYNIFVVLQ
jgi:hypothetical protein